MTKGTIVLCLALASALPAAAAGHPAVWQIEGGTAFRRPVLRGLTKGSVQVAALKLDVEIDKKEQGEPQALVVARSSDGATAWRIKERADYVRVFPNDLLVTTELMGSGETESSLRAYSALNGKLLFPYSLWFRGGLPIVVRRGGQLRYIGYHNNYGPARDTRPDRERKGGEFRLAGRLFVASPDGQVDAARVVYDPVALKEAPRCPRKLVLTTADGENVMYVVAQEWGRGDRDKDPHVDVSGKKGDPLETASLALFFDERDADSIIVPLPDGAPRLDAAVVGGNAFAILPDDRPPTRIDKPVPLSR